VDIYLLPRLRVPFAVLEGTHPVLGARYTLRDNALRPISASRDGPLEQLHSEHSSRYTWGGQRKVGADSGDRYVLCLDLLRA
jgi:hypothetical protein